MSNLIDTYSPPVIYISEIPEVGEVKFRRMLKKQWALFLSELQAELTEKENLRVNKEVPESDLEQRRKARMEARLFVERNTDFHEVVRRSTRDVYGVDRLLKFCVIDRKWEDFSDLIPFLDQTQIAREVVHMPIVKPVNPQSPAGANASGTGGQSPTKNLPGEESTPESDTPSPVLIHQS